jgi:hypothetical protein
VLLRAYVPSKMTVRTLKNQAFSAYFVLILAIIFLFARAYGSYRAKVSVRQRYWKKRVDGVRQRYWKQTKRKKTVEARGRYEFSGKGRDLYKAVVKAHRIVPRGFVTVSAEKFVEHPEDYGSAGEWIEKEVES